jgi:hypothetical protein
MKSPVPSKRESRPLHQLVLLGSCWATHDSWSFTVTQVKRPMDLKDRPFAVGHNPTAERFYRIAKTARSLISFSPSRRGLHDARRVCNGETLSLELGSIKLNVEAFPPSRSCRGRLGETSFALIQSTSCTNRVYALRFWRTAHETHAKRVAVEMAAQSPPQSAAAG